MSKLNFKVKMSLFTNILDFNGLYTPIEIQVDQRIKKKNAIGLLLLSSKQIYFLKLIGLNLFICIVFVAIAMLQSSLHLVVTGVPYIYSMQHEAFSRQILIDTYISFKQYIHV